MNDSKTNKKSILVIGIGNSGRSDDGLGWRFADMLAALEPEDVDIEYRYQLQVEDALLVSEYSVVIFADASQETLDNGFVIRPCTPGSNYYFSSHMQSAETVLYLAKELYQTKPKAFTLAIAGYDWELGTSLSNQAQQNLLLAFDDFAITFLHELKSAKVNG
jgi:hydrogenase maturation protease